MEEGWGDRLHAMVTKIPVNSDSRLGAKGVSFPQFAMFSLTSIYLHMPYLSNGMFLSSFAWQILPASQALVW